MCWDRFPTEQNTNVSNSGAGFTNVAWAAQKHFSRNPPDHFRRVDLGLFCAPIAVA
jgi:hypothetical protein